MDKFKTIAVGGLPHTLNDFRLFLGRLDAPSEGIYQAFNNLLRGFGDDFIIQGCVLSGSSGAFSITEGWILLSGELIKVDAQGPFDEAVDGAFTKKTTFDSRGTKTFLNGSIDETYEINRGVISGLAGALAFDGNTLNDIIGLTEWTDFVFNGNDFVVDTQGGGNNWDVSLPADVVNGRFRKRANTVDVQIFLDTFGISIASTVSELLIKDLPFTSKTQAIGFVSFNDVTNTDAFVGKAVMGVGGTTMSLSKVVGSVFNPPFTATTNMRAIIHMTLEVE